MIVVYSAVYCIVISTNAVIMTRLINHVIVIHVMYIQCGKIRHDWRRLSILFISTKPINRWRVQKGLNPIQTSAGGVHKAAVIRKKVIFICRGFSNH